MSERKCERCESRLYPSDKRVCVACVELDAERAAFQRGSEHGQRFERAAIVAWLRECAQRYADMYGQPVDSLPAHMYAGWIERGEHLGCDLGGIE